MCRLLQTKNIKKCFCKNIKKLSKAEFCNANWASTSLSSERQVLTTCMLLVATDCTIVWFLHMELKCSFIKLFILKKGIVQGKNRAYFKIIDKILDC